MDWKELAKRFNLQNNREVSFEGSFAEFDSATKEVTINLYVTSSQNEKTAIVMGNRNIFQLCKDASGCLGILRSSNSSIIWAPTPQSIRIGNYILYNIVPDYIEPFITNTFVPLNFP